MCISDFARMVRAGTILRIVVRGFISLKDEQGGLSKLVTYSVKRETKLTLNQLPLPLETNSQLRVKLG